MPRKVFAFSFASWGGWEPPLFSSAPGFYRSTVEVFIFLTFTTPTACQLKHGFSLSKFYVF
jgi:hypothetical protein